MGGPSGHLEGLKECRAVFLDAWEKEGKRPEDAEIFILREVYADEDTPRVKEVVWKIMLKANQNTFSARKHMQRPALKPP